MKTVDMHTDVSYYICIQYIYYILYIISIYYVCIYITNYNHTVLGFFFRNIPKLQYLQVLDRGISRFDQSFRSVGPPWMFFFLRGLLLILIGLERWRLSTRKVPMSGRLKKNIRLRPMTMPWEKHCAKGCMV